MPPVSDQPVECPCRVGLAGAGSRRLVVTAYLLLHCGLRYCRATPRGPVQSHRQGLFPNLPNALDPASLRPALRRCRRSLSGIRPSDGRGEGRLSRIVCQRPSEGPNRLPQCTIRDDDVASDRIEDVVSGYCLVWRLDEQRAHVNAARHQHQSLLLPDKRSSSRGPRCTGLRRGRRETLLP